MIPGKVLFLGSERKRCDFFSKLVREECNIICYACKNKTFKFHRVKF